MSRVVGIYACPRGIFGMLGQLGGSGVRVERTFRFPASLAAATDVGRHLRQALDGLDAGGAQVSVAVRGFGAAHHVITLPAAPDHLLAPIVEREMRRLEPELGGATFSWTTLAPEARADEAPAQRQLSVAAAPSDLLDALVDAIRGSGNVVEHVTVLGAALEEIERQFIGTDDPLALAAPLPDGLFIGFCLNGAVRLAVEPPPPANGEPEDVNAAGEELELGAMFLRQQFRGAQVARVALLAAPDRFAGAEQTLGARLSLPIERLAVAGLDAAGYAALGAVLSARASRPLTLAGRSRERASAAASARLGIAATAAIVIAIAVGAWSMLQALDARDARIALADARHRIEQESFGLTGARETVAQRRVIRDARAAMRQVAHDRAQLQETLSRIAASATDPIQLDSLRLDRATDGWLARVSGRATGMTNARAVQALSDFYGNLPRRLDVTDLTLESLAYTDSTSAPVAPQVRFSLSFDVRLAGATP